MRLRPELPRLVLGLLLAFTVPALHAGEPPSDEEVTRAIDTLKTDPDLAAETTVRRLTWDSKPKNEESSEPRRFPKWLSWIVDVFRWIFNLFGWIAEASQMLFWLLIGLFVAGLAVLIFRLIRSPGFEGHAPRFLAPTHVQDLDIRPESLPDDIGAAARQLWDRGEHRAALALLYRGLLSRLAHVYEVPIRDSSTEGDVLALAGRVLESRRTEYATRLVRTWQRAIYGGLSLEDHVVHELCAAFDAHLARNAGNGAVRGDEPAREAAA